jgi:putative transposase
MMSDFKVNCGLQRIFEGPKNSMFLRLVWKSEREDKVWLIEMPDFGSSYCKAPLIASLSELAILKKNCQLVLVELPQSPLWNESDENIGQKYTNKKGRCRLLETRDMRWGWIEGLVKHYSHADVFEGNLISGWVTQKAKETGKSRAKIYNAVFSYYAGGCVKNSLFYNWPRSGAKGEAREQKRKLGRTDAAALADPDLAKGYHLSEVDKAQIRFAWKTFLPGKSVWRAFIEMAGVFYREEELTVVKGEYVPILFPARERPTLKQFKYWGPRGDPSQSAWRLKLAAKEWWNNYKGKSGSAKDGIVAVGQLAFCDTGTNDAHLISIVSRLKPVGTLNRLLIHEARSEFVAGWHCGFEAPSARTFLMAVAHAASSKVEHFARFGIKITDDMAPALCMKVYLGDNGEYRNELSLKALDQFGSTVELAAVGAAASKGPVEGLHHVFHARLDHNLEGTTKGRQRKRGEQNPVLKACQNYFEYMREFLEEVLYYNHEEPVPHLLTAEMRREKVKPTRFEVLRWLIKKGYVSDFTPDVSVLRSHLLPALPAVLDDSGIYLLREDSGDKNERVRGLRYMADYLVSKGLLAYAAKNGATRVTVRGNPEEPSKMWLVTDTGLIELECVTDDPVLVQQGTVQDCLAIQDDDNIRRIRSRDEIEQKRSDIEVAREQRIKRAHAEKQKELDALPEKPSKADLTSGIDENRRAEIQRLNGMTSYAQPTANDEVEEPSAEVHVDESSQDCESPAHRAMRRYLQSKGAA